jgi:hypothetical protein
VDNRQKALYSPKKSTVTFFTPNTKEVNCNPGVFLNGIPIPVDRITKWLGFTISNLGSPTPHLVNGKVKGDSRLQIMKAIRGQDWGNKEMLYLT